MVVSPTGNDSFHLRKWIFPVSETAILIYISGMKHAEQIRMMFLCSHNGMRSINFCYLQVKDIYTENLNVKDVICLDYDKNKGKNKCSYYLNGQMKKEFGEYLKYLQRKWGARLTPETYIFTSQKQNKPFARSSISRLTDRFIGWFNHFCPEKYLADFSGRCKNNFIVSKIR